MSADVNAEWTQEINTLILEKPAAADTITIYADTDIDDTSGHLGATEADGGNLSLAAIATRQNAARNVVATVTDADSSITAGYAAVYGYDANGIYQREEFEFSGGTETVTGNIPFTTVDKITVWGFTGTIDNGSDNIKFGGGTKLGLPMGANCTLIDVIKESAGGALQVVNHAGVNRTYGTYICTSAPDGANEMEITYIYKRRIR